MREIEPYWDKAGIATHRGRKTCAREQQSGIQQGLALDCGEKGAGSTQARRATQAYRKAKDGAFADYVTHWKEH